MTRWVASQGAAVDMAAVDMNATVSRAMFGGSGRTSILKVLRSPLASVLAGALSTERCTTWLALFSRLTSMGGMAWVSLLVLTMTPWISRPLLFRTGSTNEIPRPWLMRAAGCGAADVTVGATVGSGCTTLGAGGLAAPLLTPEMPASMLLDLNCGTAPSSAPLAVGQASCATRSTQLTSGTCV